MLGFLAPRYPFTQPYSSLSVHGLPDLAARLLLVLLPPPPAADQLPTPAHQRPATSSRCPVARLSDARAQTIQEFVRTTWRRERACRHGRAQSVMRTSSTWEEKGAQAPRRRPWWMRTTTWGDSSEAMASPPPPRRSVSILDAYWLHV
jgi:hypothetical protein